MDILVTSRPQDDGWVLDVRIQDKTSSTRHRVTLRKDTYDRLTGGAASPDTLIKRSFEFLLEREPKESILREFDLEVIGHYFPEYDADIKRRLSQ